MYSLIGSARLNGIEPEAYLHYIIERIADHPANRRAGAAELVMRAPKPLTSPAAGLVSAMKAALL